MRMKFINGDLTYLPRSVTLPREIVPLQSPRKNQDIRNTLAYSLFESCNEGNILLYGTTRSGRTTSLISESINRNEPVLCIEPTTNIAKTTVHDAVWKADFTYPGYNVINIPSNKDGCPKIREMIKANPLLDLLQVIPRPEWCPECDNFYKCENLRILHVDHVDVISTTYHKIAAMMLSKNPIDKQILQKIRNTIKNAVFDECHKLEIEETKHVTLSRHSKQDDVTFNFNQYDVLKGDWKILKVVDEFLNIINNPEISKARDEVLEQARDSKRYFESSLRRVFDHDCGSKSYRTMLYSEVYSEIVTLCQHPEYKMKIADLLPLYDMLAIVTSPKVQICAVRDNGVIQVQLAAVDTMHRIMISNFIKTIQRKRRIILTSGTINNGSFDYSNLFFTPVNKMMWGRGGDPLNTIGKMHIYADHRKYKMRSGDSRYSLSDNIANIVDDIIKIRRSYHKVKIIAMNGKLAGELKNQLEKRYAGVHPSEIDYYNSKFSIGVECDSRVIITVGLAYKPSNTFDAVTDDPESSYVMLQETVHADTWQAISRAKDPDGVRNSYVFMLGSNLSDVEKVVTWGMDRKVRSTITTTGKTATVTYSNPISAPIVEKCKDVDDMLRKSTCQS